MTKEELQNQLLTELHKHEHAVLGKLDRLLGNIPVKAKTLFLQIFPSQEGDGMFTIYASVDGPDLYVLNKALQDYADLFNPKYTPEGLVPYIPTVDSTDVDYDVNDLVAATVGKWLETVWSKTNKAQLSIPVDITADQEACAFKSIKLH